MGIRTEHIKGLLEGISEEDALGLVTDLAMRFDWLQVTYNRENIIVMNDAGDILNDWYNPDLAVTDQEFAAIINAPEWKDTLQSIMFENGSDLLPRVTRHADGTFEVHDA